MPASYVIDKERGLVISKATGMFTGADAEAHQKALLADENFQSSFHQLLDLSGMSQLVLSSHWVKQLAERSIFSEKSRRAFLVSGQLPIGMSRMFATYREIAGGREQIKIFEDREEAMRWLMQG